ncbi:MAG: PH domain-containing protein [Candidatus Gracilibacteria bacterium]|nr:PH domain-containing protein [Candidatus Gracilibacteria bacterium]
MSLWILIGQLLLLELVLMLSYFLVQNLSSPLQANASLADWFDGRGLTFLILHVLEILLVIYLTLRWSSVRYIIGQKTITIAKGIFLVRQNTFATENVESVKVHRNLWGLLFGFGNIILYAPTLNERIRLKAVRKPHELAKTIQSFISKSDKKKRVMPIERQ